MKRFLTSFALVLASLVLAAPAAADVVGPPPASCPDGSDPNSCHGGPFCSPISCTTDADCTAGTCKEISYCVKTIPCAGNIPPGTDPSQYNRDGVTGLCTSSCAAPDACKTVKVCAVGTPSGSGGSGTSSGGCSVRVGGEAAGEAALFAAIAGALVVAARRRRQRASQRRR